MIFDIFYVLLWMLYGVKKRMAPIGAQIIVKNSNVTEFNSSNDFLPYTPREGGGEI